MGRLRCGMILRTNYGTGPYVVEEFTENCTCPSFVDSLNLGSKAPLSSPHSHIVCRTIGRKDRAFLNGYDENLNSVWNSDRLIVCEEETLFLTMACDL